MSAKRALIALVSLAVGVASGYAAARSSPPATSTSTVRVTTIEMVNGTRSAGPAPGPIPNFLEGATDPRRLVLADAVPSDANLVSADYVEETPRQLIVTWDREHLTRNGQAAVWERRGIAIWQLDPYNPRRGPTWHRVYTFENPIINRTGIDTVNGFDVSTGDI